MVRSLVRKMEMQVSREPTRAGDSALVPRMENIGFSRFGGSFSGRDGNVSVAVEDSRQVSRILRGTGVGCIV